MDYSEQTAPKISSYKLPVIDVEKSRRNFEGLSKNQWYSLGELQSGEYCNTTNTNEGKTKDN